MAAVAPAAQHRHAEPDAPSGGFSQDLKSIALDCARHNDQQQVVAVIEQVGKVQDASAFGRTQVASGQQSRQPAPAVAGRWIGNDVGRTVGKDQPRAGDQLELDFCTIVVGSFGRIAQRLIGADDAGDGVAIGDADARMAGIKAGRDHLVRMRCAVEEREVGRCSEFGKASHANRPCRYQPGNATSSPYSP